MNDYALLTAYKAMLYVAREENLEIKDKHEKLEEIILEKFDLDVTDMIDNLDSFYDILTDLPTLQNDDN